MKSYDTRPWLFFAVLLLAAIFFCFGFLEHREKRLAWNGAIQRHETCHALVKQIRRLETVPRFAVLNADSPQAISARIEGTARNVLSPSSLVGIQSESGRRLGNTPYLVNPTLIQLRGVTLADIASFATELEDVEKGLVVSELRLIDPEPAEGIEPERWSGDLKLTQTIYSANVSRQ